MALVVVACLGIMVNKSLFVAFVLMVIQPTLSNFSDATHVFFDPMFPEVFLYIAEILGEYVVGSTVHSPE